MTAVRSIGVLALAVFLPAVAYAQASIAGVARDTSGAVLPGVTVEASSPALIERTRTVVTDGSGQYRLVDLRPGTYVVIFTLTGFSTVRRDGVELAGSAVTTVSVEMRVGELSEAITVTGQAPTVDIQSVNQQRVLGKEVIDAIPSGRMVNSLAVLIPGITSNITEVGGTNFGQLAPQLSIHGGRAGDGRFTVDGLSPASAEGNGQYTGSLPNMTAAQEVTIDTSGASAETASGGVVVNLVPREGGNQFKGTFFGAGAWSGLQSSNFTDELKARGLATPNALINTYDVNPGFGGPIKQDRIWFFSAGRWNHSRNSVGGMFYNKNAGLPEAWTYVPDTSRPADNRSYFHSINTRVTLQVSRKNKIALYYDDQTRCACPNTSSTTAPEASAKNYGFPMNRFATVTWSAPLTNKLLLEAGIADKHEAWHGSYRSDAEVTMIRVTEQSTGLTYRGIQTFREYRQQLNSWRGAMSIVTGSHAFKAGVNHLWASKDDQTTGAEPPIAYRLNNGIPNQISESAAPFSSLSNIKYDIGLYAQDKWTISRFTLNLGARLDMMSKYFPAQSLGPAPLTPTRNVSFARQDFVNWKDVTPRIGVAYDLFGDGRTAVKVSLNKYVLGSALQGAFGDAASPTNRLSLSATRSWNDANSNFVPDCDLTSVVANGECGALSDRNFGGQTASTTYDPDAYQGWGVRGYNWEFSTSIQREIVPRVSVDVGYFRRIYGNFFITDNRAVAPQDFTRFSITAPVDSRLPGGGGYVIGNLYNLNPDKVGQVDNYLTSSSAYGEQAEHWSGVDVNVRARMAGGINVQGGVSTGKSTVRSCNIYNALPELGAGTSVNALGGVNTNSYGVHCDYDTPFLTQVKGVATYTVPRLDVQLSGTFQSVPGGPIQANYVATNAVVQPSLGRPLSGGAANTTVNLVAPGQMYGDRMNQVDLRFGKVLTFRQTRSVVSIDLYNALNANPVLGENSSYAVWRQAQSILNARYVRFSLQLDF